ncbi:MAG: radical SAM protein [Gammaproteobacteria bacterium]
MISTLYIEEAVLDHPRSRELRARFPRAAVVPCRHYGEVFNRKGQHFRLQKRRPALILARKHDNFLLPAPPQYGIGGRHNFYFSHMLNCLYDCRYCFLQGMYRSAHYVLFVNYEDFQDAIQTQAGALPDTQYFYSGYDCDSLALEPLSGFCQSFLPMFRRLPHCVLELRTKSTQVRALLEMEPLPNCVVAFSITPEALRQQLEGGVPPLERRLAAMEKLVHRGWPLGLRFDPLIYHRDYAALYEELFATLFARLPASALHSVSLGAFRLPEDFHRAIVRLYPDDPFLAGPFAARQGMVAYRKELEEEMLATCKQLLQEYLPAAKLFLCH